MAPARRSPAALVYILLLLSLHAHPAAARRTAEEGAHRSDLGVGHERSDAGVDLEMMSEMAELFRLEREEVDALMGADTERMCGWGYSTTMRTYHFEFDVVGAEQGHVRHFAAELVRAPLAPRLVLHVGRTWSVRYTEDPNYPVDWVLTPLTGAGDEHYSVQIDFLYEVQYVKRFGKKGLHIKFANGTDLQLSGGLYYPEKIVAIYLRGGGGPKKGEKPGATAYNATGGKGANRAGVNAFANGAGVVGSEVGKQVVNFGTKGGLGGVALGFGLSYGFSSAVLLMNNILNSFLTYIGAAATVSINIGIQPLTAVQILSFTSTAGGIGLAGGVAIGLGLGLVVGIPAGVATFINQWLHQRKELGLSASSKIFAKLDCHRHFKRCGVKGKTLVPDRKRCPRY